VNEYADHSGSGVLVVFTLLFMVGSALSAAVVLVFGGPWMWVLKAALIPWVPYLCVTLVACGIWLYHETSGNE